jgi:hypothetical protein
MPRQEQDYSRFLGTLWSQQIKVGDKVAAQLVVRVLEVKNSPGEPFPQAWCELVYKRPVWHTGRRYYDMQRDNISGSWSLTGFRKITKDEMISIGADQTERLEQQAEKLIPDGDYDEVRAGTMPGKYRCRRCGAAVALLSLHDRFHAELDGFIDLVGQLSREATGQRPTAEEAAARVPAALLLRFEVPSNTWEIELTAEQADDVQLGTAVITVVEEKTGEQLFPVADVRTDDGNAWLSFSQPCAGFLTIVRSN